MPPQSKKRECLRGSFKYFIWLKFYLAGTLLLPFRNNISVGWLQRILPPLLLGERLAPARVTKEHRRCVARGRCRYNLSFFRFNVKDSALMIRNNSHNHIFIHPRA